LCWICPDFVCSGRSGRRGGRFDGGEIFCVSFHASAADFLSCRSSETKKPPFGGSAATTETTAGPRVDRVKSEEMHRQAGLLGEQIDEAEMRWLEVHEALEGLPAVD